MLARLLARAPWRRAGHDQVRDDLDPSPQTLLNPIERAPARYPHLLPTSATLADYARWLIQIGEEPSDESLAWYGDVCELAGWSVPDPNEPVPLISEPVPEPAPQPVPPVPAPLALLQPPMDANQAAKSFLAWVISTGRTGTHSSGDLRRLYSGYCVEHNVTPTPENKLRGALRKLPGVTTAQHTVAIRKTGSRHQEPRVREWHWTLRESNRQPLKLAA